MREGGSHRGGLNSYTARQARPVRRSASLPEGSPSIIWRGQGGQYLINTLRSLTQTAARHDACLRRWGGVTSQGEYEHHHRNRAGPRHLASARLRGGDGRAPMGSTEADGEGFPRRPQPHWRRARDGAARDGGNPGMLSRPTRGLDRQSRTRVQPAGSSRPLFCLLRRCLRGCCGCCRGSRRRRRGSRIGI